MNYRLLSVAVFIGFMLLGAASSNCALPPAKLPTSHLPVPIIRQATSYSCGAASLMAILYYWKVYDDKESSLYEPLKTTEENGTDPSNIVKVAKELGLEAYTRDHLRLLNLRHALDRGETVVLDIQAWRDGKEKNLSWKKTWESGHYVVLIAMDDHYAYAMDPSAGVGYAYLPLNELLARWHDYETKNGKIKKFHHFGIFIRGKKPIKHFPTKLIRIH